MQEVIGPLDQALAHGGRQVVSTVYEELQAFLTRVDRWSAPGEQVLTRPMTGLASLLTRDRNDVEAVRKGRAEAILAYLSLRPQIRSVPDTLDESLRAWRAGERSITVQRTLDQALGLVP